MVGSIAAHLQVNERLIVNRTVQHSSAIVLCMALPIFHIYLRCFDLLQLTAGRCL